MTALFVSDLHLDPSRPAATDCFQRFLAGPGRDTGSLYILGDLFEAWTGDDLTGAHERQVIDALGRYTSTGHSCYFLRGNRDFLVGPRFAAETGMTLLADEALIEIDGRQALLMHGDTLCTDDRAYQRYRRVARHPVVQAAYLALPARVRTGIAAYARRRSSAANAGKAAAIMDVNQETVLDALRRHRVQLLIHGHTHRPAIHALAVDGQPARRIVLGDWYQEGSVLQWTGSGQELRKLAFG